MLILDEMMAEGKNVEKLHDALQIEFDKHPVRFFRQIVMPLLPKESLVAIQRQEPQVVRWTSLMASGNQRPAAACT